MTKIQIPFFTGVLPEQSALRKTLNDAYRMDETTCINNLLNYLAFTPEIEEKIKQHALKLVNEVREQEKERGGVDALMTHYDLSTEEGILLMCLAEALLRVPDKETENLLIKDKLTSASWDKHIGASESSFVNMATWGLALSGKILKKPGKGYFKSIWSGLVRRSGEVVIRRAVREAMRVMSENFILGRGINEARKRSQTAAKEGYRFSFDMLGEIARTQADADRYYESYYDAITALGTDAKQDIMASPSISVKLTALDPRYEYKQRETVIPILINCLKDLVLHAKKNNVAFTVDAEEAERLDLSLDIFEAIYTDPALKNWEGFGLAIQAYQKRAIPLIDWLVNLARQEKKRIPVRLVKGAYWDTEIKQSQVEGLEDYPVFTRKANTDVSYLACAKRMLAAQDVIYPQFATHNAYSVAAILAIMGEKYHDYQFEFQNLQGMGKALHDHIVRKDQMNLSCRIYAPVGTHEDLLPYLVRRLLENGANSSFVNRIADHKIPVEDLIAPPVSTIKALDQIPNPKIPLPKNIFGKARINSMGIDFSNVAELTKLAQEMKESQNDHWEAAPFNRKVTNGKPVFDPTDNRRQVGVVENATKEDVERGMQNALAAFPQWDARDVSDRAKILCQMADLLEENRAQLMQMAIREAGKTLPNAISEVREAADFCRYYAYIADTHLTDKTLPSYTGETDILRMQGRGVMLCISPWNFPIAIFTGQVAAALVTGNAVIAKPARQTSLIAAFIVKLFHAAGVPQDVVQLMPGPSNIIGPTLISNPLIAGVLLTGSCETASAIQKTLAERKGPIVPFIAETGGINAMIADSTALPEQLVRDILISAFDSSGQRCSALRLLFIQDDIAERVITMLAGAMAEMRVGDPMLLASDVGPVIDKDSHTTLAEHQAYMRKEAKLIYKVALPSETEHGTFIAPQAYELPNIRLLKKEVFGPILHVVRYRREDLDKVIADINALGYGLTFGIQSRIDEKVDYIQRRIKAGNIYVNRNIIGAVVGVQPFGGGRLSGTGPKAGGPHYLSRLCSESTLTIDTTAAGGNASLMALGD